MIRRHLVAPALLVLVSASLSFACSSSDDDSSGSGASSGQGGSSTAGASGQGGAGAKAGSGGKGGSQAAGASGSGGASGSSAGKGGSSGKGGGTAGASGSVGQGGSASGAAGQGGSPQGGQGQGGSSGAGAEGGSAGQGAGGSGAEGGSSGQGGAGGNACPFGSTGGPSWGDTCAPCAGVPCSPGDTCHSAFHQGMPLDDYCTCGPSGTMECTICFPFPVCNNSYPRCDGLACAGAGGGGGSAGQGGEAGSAGQGGEGGSSGQGGSGGAQSCLGSDLLAGLGKSTVLVGAAMEDATAKAAPWDGRYQYLAGGVPDGSGTCASCATGCTSAGQSCSNASGCGWWGCWQYDQDPPGAFVRDFVQKAKGDGQIPMITYYEILQASGASEGMGEVTAANDLSFMKRYLADFRFLAQQIGSETAFVHIEPDFWGYTEQAGPDPHQTPAKVSQALPDDCGSFEDTIAGLGRCMIAVVHKHAPNARVGLHASAWGTNIDVLANKDASFDVAGEAKKLGAFLVECGAGDGDFIVADMSDRDAGFYQAQGKDTFWDDTNATLPNFTQAFAWSKALAEQIGKPVVWWQIPVGNMAQNDTTNHWKDNRVDYLLTHAGEVSASHGVGLFFGAGEGQQTTPESDGGNLVSRVKALAAAGGQKVCGM